MSMSKAHVDPETARRNRVPALWLAAAVFGVMIATYFVRQRMISAIFDL